MLLLSGLSTSFTPPLLQKEVCCCSSAARSGQPHIASLPRHRRTRLQAVRQSEDEGVDDSINAEFARIAARQRAVADSARLELVWEVAKVVALCNSSSSTCVPGFSCLTAQHIEFVDLLTPLMLTAQSCAAASMHEIWSVQPTRRTLLPHSVLLQWQRRKPKTCESCEGSGKSSCSFCNGTGQSLGQQQQQQQQQQQHLPNKTSLSLAAGAMRVGDQLFCSLTEGCKGCPVCKRKVGTCLKTAACCTGSVRSLTRLRKAGGDQVQELQGNRLSCGMDATRARMTCRGFERAL